MAHPTVPEPPTSAAPRKVVHLGEVAVLFLRLGATAFGGPAAHIALMEDECVRRRGWLTRERFLDLLGATNLLPGPSSTEMALHLGYLRAGWPGLVTAGVCFILPSTLVVAVLAWVYVAYGTVLTNSGLLEGMKPVALAIIGQAIWKLARTAVRDAVTIGVAAAALIFNALGWHALLVLFAAGAVAVVVRWVVRPQRGAALLSVPGILLSETGAGAATASGLWPIFLLFLKVGAVLFGSGYVLFAFLRADLVEQEWYTEAGERFSEQHLLDAIAVGQVTPGPVSTAATFIGYVLRGPAGAAVATIAIFLPAFVYVAASGPLIPFLRRSKTASDFLDGVTAASLALMAVVTWQLGRGALFSEARAWWLNAVAWAIALVGLALLVRWRVNSAWLMLGGAAVGVLLFRSAA
jgi:chromate transporter